MKLSVRAASDRPPGEQPVEVVERKGIGHPDTMCDGIAERVCVRLCRHYRKRFGVILHHNVDKVLLVGGAARPAFGGGEVTEPIEIYLAGRVTLEHRGERVPADEIATEACRDWLREHARNVDVSRHVKVVPRLRPGSSELRALVGRARANDTSCGVGFAPPTALERAVLAADRALAEAGARERPELGEDVKVMGVRRDGEIALTIGCAFVGRHVASADDYAQKKALAAALARDAAAAAAAAPVRVAINAGDDPERGAFYLTVTGTSAESGDDGEVGRGNRVGGLITPNRPMTLEAAAGKNPVSHVGKLYNVLGHRIAAAVARELAARDATCMLVSRIGSPVDDPELVDVRLAADGEPPRGRVEEIVRGELASLDALRDELLAERITLY